MTDPKAELLWAELCAAVKELPALQLYSVAGAYKKGAPFADLPLSVQTALSTIASRISTPSGG